MFKQDKVSKVSQNLLKEGYAVKLTVTGNSMFPFLLNEETVRIAPVDQSKLKVGDILVFKSKGHFIAHRLIRIEKNDAVFITKGDFCLHKDAPFTKEQILGKITRVYREHSEFDLERFPAPVINFIFARLSFMLPFIFRGLKKIGCVKIPGTHFHNS